jgi:hypothetical protein
MASRDKFKDLVVNFLVRLAACPVQSNAVLEYLNLSWLAKDGTIVYRLEGVMQVVLDLRFPVVLVDLRLVLDEPVNPPHAPRRLRVVALRRKVIASQHPYGRVDEPAQQHLGDHVYFMYGVVEHLGLRLHRVTTFWS